MSDRFVNVGDVANKLRMMVAELNEEMNKACREHGMEIRIQIEEKEITPLPYDTTPGGSVSFDMLSIRMEMEL